MCQNQLLVLQHTGIAGVNYQMRCLPPQTFEDQMRAHDERVICWAEQVLGVVRANLPHILWQLALPISIGGFGLGSAVATSPSAYIAAVVNSMQWAPLLRKYGRASSPLPRVAQLTNLTDAMKRVHDYALRAQETIYPARLDRMPPDLSTVLPLNEP
jgi:hypothetical protein